MSHLCRHTLRLLPLIANLFHRVNIACLSLELWLTNTTFRVLKSSKYGPPPVLMRSTQLLYSTVMGASCIEPFAVEASPADIST